MGGLGRRRYGSGRRPRGERTPFFLGGESSIRSAYLTAAYGLFDGIELWGQTAVHRLRYADQGRPHARARR